MLYFCLKNTHRFLPPSFFITRRYIWKFEVEFTESCRYNLHGADQQDWNKLLGVGYDLLRNTRSSAMIGWRYNVEKGCIEISPYTHLEDGQVVKDKNIIDVPIGEKTVILLNTMQNCWEIAENKYLIPKIVEPNILGRFITPWFGGNKRAHQLICLHIKR